MHYTGTIWRPPYEASSLLLEVTAGCTHHKCKFCTLYHDLPFQFKMSPMADIEKDLQEVQKEIRHWSRQNILRVFLTGANPFVLSYDKLTEIAKLIHQYLPSVKSIGSFARITDITPKTDKELAELHAIGYDGLTIGIETGDDEALQFMNKGYNSADIIEQCQRLDAAGIRYSFFYLVSISGANHGESGAKLTADVCNQLNPMLIGANMLTIYPDSDLFHEIVQGNWQEETELAKYKEIRTLVEHLSIKTTFAALGASNAFNCMGDCRKIKENCWKFSIKLSKMSVKKNYEDIEKVFIIYKEILVMKVEFRKHKINIDEEKNKCTSQVELGGRRMRRTRLLYRRLPDVLIINAGFAAYIKMNAFECRLLKNLRRI